MPIHPPSADQSNPLALWEIRELHRLAREAKVLTQMGNQGGIGRLKEIRLWTNRPLRAQGPMTRKTATWPEGVDWDLFLGVEPSEPYFEFEVPAGVPANPSRGYCIHPRNWRGWWQFGSGALGDMGCHIMDATISILGQLIPEKIEVESGPISRSSHQCPLTPAIGVIFNSAWVS